MWNIQLCVIAVPRRNNISIDLREVIIAIHQSGKGCWTIFKQFGIHRSSRVISTPPRRGHPIRFTSCSAERHDITPSLHLPRHRPQLADWILKSLKVHLEKDWLAWKNYQVKASSRKETKKKSKTWRHIFGLDSCTWTHYKTSACTQCSAPATRPGPPAVTESTMYSSVYQSTVEADVKQDQDSSYRKRMKVFQCPSYQTSTGALGGLCINSCPQLSVNWGNKEAWAKTAPQWWDTNNHVENDYLKLFLLNVVQSWGVHTASECRLYLLKPPSLKTFRI